MISLARRVTLIKAVISSMPLYLLLLFKIPRAVCNSFNQIQRQFLWGWVTTAKK